MKSEILYAKITHPSNPEIIANAKIVPHEDGFEIENFTVLLMVQGKMAPVKFNGEGFDKVMGEIGFDPHEARIEIEDQIADRRSH